MRLLYNSYAIINAMLKKGVITFLIFFILVFFVPESTAKRLPRAGSGVKRVRSGGASVIVSAKLRADRRAINAYFANLNLASSVTYSLTYKTDGKVEGVGGSIDTAGVYSTSRELVFGTESGGVFKYHSNITDAKLEVVSTLKSGKKAIRRFRVRV